MAVDTRDKRMSMIGLDLVDPMMANPSGSVGVAARAMLLWLYSGVPMYILRKVIEFTAKLYSRTLNAKLCGRIYTTSLFARILTAKLLGTLQGFPYIFPIIFGRIEKKIEVKLEKRKLNIKTRTK